MRKGDKKEEQSGESETGGVGRVKAYNVFMNADLSEYIGEWIAISDNEIVAHGKDIKALYDKAKKKYPNLKVTLTKVPEKQNCIF